MGLTITKEELRKRVNNILTLAAPKGIDTGAYLEDIILPYCREDSDLSKEFLMVAPPVVVSLLEVQPKPYKRAAAHLQTAIDEITALEEDRDLNKAEPKHPQNAPASAPLLAHPQVGQ